MEVLMDRSTLAHMALLAFAITAILIVSEGMGHWLRAAAHAPVLNNPSRLIVQPRISL
jgi:hypothetical protein